MNGWFTMSPTAPREMPVSAIDRELLELAAAHRQAEWHWMQRVRFMELGQEKATRLFGSVEHLTGW
jgi:hypothetical protein